MIYDDYHLRVVSKCADKMGLLKPSWSNDWNGEWGHSIYCELPRSRCAVNYNPITNPEQSAQLERWLLDQGVIITKHHDRVLFSYQGTDYAHQPAVNPEDKRLAIAEFVYAFDSIQIKKPAKPEQPQHFNKLKPSEAERLACLIEECSEVIQAASKILRHGYDSSGYDNSVKLSLEVADVLSVVDLMVKHRDLKRTQLEAARQKSTRKRKNWLHHHYCGKD